MIALDSSFIIDILRNKADAVAIFDSIKNEQLATTIINVYELVSGVYQVKDKNYDKHLNILKNFLARIKILYLDRESAFESSKINARLSMDGRIIDDLDILIGGICISNNCKKIITKNKKHFDRIKGLEVVNY